MAATSTASSLAGDSRESILGNVHLISDIINSALAVARKEDVRTEQTDVNLLLQSALALTRPVVRTRIELRTELGDLPSIWASPTRLIQVFLNLLRNAGKAVADTGTITVVSERTEAGVRVRVSDTGCGMSSEVLAKAFTPFFTTDPEDGTGLGLAICHEVVEQHNGTLSIESEVGHGTTVVVELPTEAEKKQVST